ncbi:multiheme c-type cytochrome [Planctomycetota bacterium]
MARRRKRRKHLVRRLLFGIVVLAVIGAVVGILVTHPGGGNGRTHRRIRRGTPVGALYFTCDIQGKLVPCACEEGPLGGVARIAGLVGQWSADRPDGILVDVGNATLLGHDDSETINRFAFEALDAMGCTVVNCGENEVALPRDQLESLAKDRKFHVVSASLIDSASGNNIFPSHHIEARGGVQIAFIGLVHNDMDVARIGKGLRLLEPEDALRSTLASIGDQADLIVALAYLPADQIYELARKYPKVNVFLGGRAGATSAAYELVRKSVVAYLGDQGMSLGRIEAAFPQGQLPDVHASIHLLDHKAPEAESMKDIVGRYRDAIPAKKLPGADFDPKMPCSSSYVASEVCRLCHIDDYYSWQATAHAGAYVTLLQKEKHKDAACLPCHVTGYTMPDGFADKLNQVKQAQAAAQKLELEQALRGIGAGGKRQDLEKQLKELEAVDLGAFAKLKGEELEKKKVGTERAFEALKNVGCECCHGGGRRHVAVGLKDRTAAAKVPYQRAVVSARSCSRCHNGERPCLNAEEGDPFDLEEYLKKIKHWP